MALVLRHFILIISILSGVSSWQSADTITDVSDGGGAAETVPGVRVEEAYGEWSQWAPCATTNSRCRQQRYRTCLRAEVCGSSPRITQRRLACREPAASPRHLLKCVGRDRSRRRYSRARRAGRRRVVRVSWKRDISPRSSRYQEKRDAYSEWTIWSRCTRRCRKRRYRYCQRKSACGNDVLSEEMQCGPKGSRCARKLAQLESLRPTEVSKAERRTELSILTTTPTAVKATSNVTTAVKSTELPAGFDTATCGRRAKEYPESRIYGGKPSKHGKWPWQVALLNRFKEPYCGGTLIADQWVLTAAHCIKRRLYALLGDHNFRKEEGTEQLFKVTEAYRHPDYHSATYDNDIGVLRLERPVDGGEFARAACLPAAARWRLPADTSCFVMGWGKRRDSHTYGTHLLYEARVPLVEHARCQRAYDNFHITANMLCAGYEERGRADSCGGDSGGPLMCSGGAGGQWTVYGITSFGEGCGDTGKYGVYSRVTNYLPWIHRVIRRMEEPSYKRSSKGKRSAGISPLDMIMRRIKKLLAEKLDLF